MDIPAGELKPKQDTGQVNELLAQIQLEEKIKDGAENMLHELDSHKIKSKPVRDNHKKQVMAQLQKASSKIDLLKDQLRTLGFDEDGVAATSSTTSFAGPSPSFASSSAPASAATPSTYGSDNASTPFLAPASAHLNGETPERAFSSAFDELDVRKPYSWNLKCVNRLADVLAAYPILRAEFSMHQINDRLRDFLLSSDTRLLCMGYRLCRLVIASHASISALRRLHIDYFIIQTLTKSDDFPTQNERIQAMNLIRAFLNIPGGVNEISFGVIRAMVAVAESSGDKLAPICIETLAEIMIVDPEKASASGAIKVLIQMMLDGARELAVPLAMAMSLLLDSPNSRHFLRDGQDLAGVVTIFTDVQLYATSPPPSERMSTASAVIVTMLRNWAGLSCFDLENLISCMIIPIRVLQESLIGIFAEVLALPDDSIEHALTNHYTAYLLHKCLEKGLMDKLVHLQKKGVHWSVQHQARDLISRVYQLCSLLMPRQLMDRALAMPSELRDDLNRASGFDLPSAAVPIFEVDSALKGRRKGKMGLATGGTNVYIKMGTQIDDITFKNQIASTHVLTTKAFTRWNWDVLLELIQGPLRNPKRLDEAIRTTKFMKRLLSFYRPFKYRFASIKMSSTNHKYINVGKELVLSLLDTTEGIRYLANNKLLRQVAECLAQLDPSSGITSAEPLFSARRLRSTLSYGYFEILGVLSKSRVGQQMLSQMRVFNMFYQICEIDREDVMRLFISSMDYALNGHPRIILSKALTASAVPVRLFATEFLNTLIDTVDPFWIVDLLVAQLYDPAIEVCEMAVRVILRFCRDGSILDHFISMMPSISHLGEVGAPLNMLFLSRPEGFDYLQSLDYVHREMDAWVHGLNDRFVGLMERYLESANNWWLVEEETPQGVPVRPTKVMPHPPRHFFGELVLTTKGCATLKNTALVDVFAQYIADNLYALDADSCLKLKANLWALSHIGSQPLGAEFITMDMVLNICKIYRDSSVYSVRGTAFYALGLISSTFEGAELLTACGWSTASDSMGGPVAVALVGDREAFDKAIGPPPSEAEPEVPSESLDPNEFVFDNNIESRLPSRRPSEQSLSSHPLYLTGNSSELFEFPRREDPAAQSVLEAISDLSNHIMATDASKKLVSLRGVSPYLFCDVELFKSAMKLLENFHFKQVVRRFVFELFDTKQIFERLLRRKKSHFRI